jgi:glyceraldehyde-3-phosphate dehydrogenase (ferredoxin)
MDNAGICRFHRAWAEEMIPDIVQELFGKKREYLDSLGLTGSRINSRNVSLFWESARSRDFVHTFLKRKRDVDNDADPVLAEWIARFDSDSLEAAREFWYEMRKGIDESLCEFA